MKKVLVLAAISLLAFASAADAKTKSYVVSLSDSCVVAKVNLTGQQITVNENDKCQTFIGAGLVGKVKKAGNQAIIGGISSQFAGDEILINLSYPLVSGGTYAIYKTSDGVTLTSVGAGTYTVK